MPSAVVTNNDFGNKHGKKIETQIWQLWSQYLAPAEIALRLNCAYRQVVEVIDDLPTLREAVEEVAEAVEDYGIESPDGTLTAQPTDDDTVTLSPAETQQRLDIQAKGWQLHVELADQIAAKIVSEKSRLRPLTDAEQRMLRWFLPLMSREIRQWREAFDAWVAAKNGA